MVAVTAVKSRTCLMFELLLVLESLVVCQFSVVVIWVLGEQTH